MCRCLAALCVMFALLPMFARAADKPLGKLPGAAGGPASQPTSTPGFVIGVFSQPASSFGLWKARGINTLVGYESESKRVPQDDWSGLAVDLGLFFIRPPSDPVADDLDEGYLLAWMHADEPDVQNPPTDPRVLAEETKLWHSVTKPGTQRTGKDIPIFCNFSGGNVLFNKTPRKLYEAYIQQSDWIGSDFYPVTGWNRPDWLTHVGNVVDQLRDWSQGKPQFAFIETSAQRLDWTPKDTPGPTPAQFRAEVWNAVIHGAKGVIYFPQQIGYGFQFDATTPPVVAEMVKQNKRLTQLADILKTPINPGPLKVETAGSIEAAWRIVDHTAYIFALNPSAKALHDQHLQLSGIDVPYAIAQGEDDRPIKIDGGKLIDDFESCQVHIYVIKLP